VTPIAAVLAFDLAAQEITQVEGDWCVFPIIPIIAYREDLGFDDRNYRKLKLMAVENFEKRGLLVLHSGWRDDNRQQHLSRPDPKRPLLVHCINNILELLTIRLKCGLPCSGKLTNCHRGLAAIGLFYGDVFCLF